MTWHELAERGIDVRSEIPAVYTTLSEVGIGPARLHHLVTTKELTSKSGAGRCVRDVLDPQWNAIAREALRIREDPGASSLYEDPAQRGRDTYELLTWLIEDGTSTRAD